MNECFDSVMSYLKQAGFKSVVYKPVPHMYFTQMAEEDRFSLFQRGATIKTIDASTVVNLSNSLKMPKGRKAQISRASREGVCVKALESAESYDAFMTLENDVLSKRHNTTAVHSSDEISMLHKNFPNNIHLFGAFKDGSLMAGTVVYEYENLVHTQYMAANDEARQIGALDLVVATVMEHYSHTKKWFDFGISSEHGSLLNEGLISFKEGFGGRTAIYETWELEL